MRKSVVKALPVSLDTVTLEPILFDSLTTIALLAGESLQLTVTNALSEWMQTTGDLLIETSGQTRAYKRDNLLEFKRPDPTERAKGLKQAFRPSRF